MSEIEYKIENKIAIITINREEKSNAFDETLLQDLSSAFNEAINNEQIRVIVLKGEGKNFSAGADLTWMQRVATYSLEENIKDALILANLMATIYHSPKPTIAMIQGSTYGGGIGLIAACDIAIAATDAHFCFSEVKLGLIPAVISPYVIKAIGERSAKALFMSAETFDAERALALHLIHQCTLAENLFEYTLNYARAIADNAPFAVMAAKKLVHEVAGQTIDANLGLFTAAAIAEQRGSVEGKKGIQAFLQKQKPNWD